MELDSFSRGDKIVLHVNLDRSFHRRAGGRWFPLHFFKKTGPDRLEHGEAFQSAFSSSTSVNYEVQVCTYISKLLPGALRHGVSAAAPPWKMFRSGFNNQPPGARRTIIKYAVTYDYIHAAIT